MRILITGASSRFAQAIATELGEEHDLLLMDSVPVEVTGKRSTFMQGSLLNHEDTWKAVRGIDALIHTGNPPSDLPPDGLKQEQMLLDLGTRGTHNICKAAVEAGVKKILYAGTLEIFSTYPDDVYISEMWKPLPTPEMAQMARYLGELTCREFARDYMVTATSLRLGKLVLEEEVEGQSPDLMWLDLRDAAQAFRCALKRDASHHVWWTARWAMYHVCADIPNPKFLIDSAVHGLGYKPTHNFSAHYHV